MPSVLVDALLLPRSVPPSLDLPQKFANSFAICSYKNYACKSFIFCSYKVL